MLEWIIKALLKLGAILERWALELLFSKRLRGLLRFLKRRDFLRPYLCRKELERAGSPFTAEAFIGWARAGELDLVKLFVDAAMNINHPGSGGERALIAAARHGRHAVVQFLIDQPQIDLNATNDEHDTALIVAARENQLEIVKALVKATADVNLRNRKNESAWIEALRHAEPAVQDVFEDPNVKADDRDVKTWKIRVELEHANRFYADAFIEACAQGQVAEVRRFLEAGMDVNTRDSVGQTPLLAAAQLEDPAVVDLLLAQNNVDVNVRDNERGDTPLILASRAHRTTVVQSLLKHPQIKVTLPNSHGETALLEAARRGFDDIIAELERAGATEADLASKVAQWKIEQLKLPLTENTFLEMVRQRRASEITFFLEAGIAAGINIKCRDKDGNTALLLTAGTCDVSILKLLLAAFTPEDVKASNHQGETALIVAARENCLDSVKELLNAGAEFSARDKAGETALLAAARREFSDIVEELTKAGAHEPELEKKVARWQLERDQCWSESKFVDAVWRNNDALVRKFLLAGMDVNARDERKETALIAATRNEKLEMVQLLLEQDGIDVKARNHESATALEIAESRKFSEIVELLQVHGKSVPQFVARRMIREKGLRYAPEVFVSMAENGQIEAVALFLQAGMHPNAEDDRGRMALIEAARNGHKAVVEMLLDSGADPSLADRNGVTAREVAGPRGYQDIADLLTKDHDQSPPRSNPLLIAMERGDVEDVRDALSAGASADTYNDEGRPVLIEAVLLERSDILAELLTHGAKIDRRDRDGMTALMRAAEMGSIDTLRLLLESHEPAVDATDPEGRTALILAAWQGRVEAVKMLIQAGANPSIADHKGRTALIASKLRGHQSIVEMLEGAGVVDDADHGQLLLAASRGEDERLTELLAKSAGNIEVPDEEGNTPLALAAAGGWTRAMEILLGAGAQANAPNGRGDTPLMLAARTGRLAAVQLLLDHADKGTLANATNQSGETALLQAAVAGRGAAVELLAPYTEQPDLGAEGRTPLVEMCYHGETKAVAALIDAHADLNQQLVIRGKSPLMTAILAGNSEIVQLLKANGAWAGELEAQIFLAAKSGDDETLKQIDLKKVDLNARDRSGWTALMLAANEGHDGIVKLLLEHGADADRVGPDKGETALRLAASKGRAGSLALLINKTKRSKSADSQALVEAAAAGHSEAIRLLVQNAKAPVNGLEGRRVPLIEAATKGHLQAVKMLQELGADLRIKTRQGMTALSAALLNNREAVVNFLLEHGAQGDDLTGFNEIQLLIAAGKPNLKEVERLLALAEPPDLDARDERGRTALMRACEKRAEEVVEVLLAAYERDKLKLALMARDVAQRTPLMWAAIGGSPAIVDRLLNLQADIYSESKKKRTALMEACKAGRLRSVELLLNAFKSDDERLVAVNHQDDDGNTPLTEAFAAIHGRGYEYSQIVTLLERNGAVQGRDLAMFWKAVEGCDLPTVKSLAANIDLNKVRHKEKTPLMLAVEAGCYDVTAFLIDKHADVDERGPNDATALILATRKAIAGLKDEEIVRLLLKEKADYDWTDADESSALLYAIRNRREKIVKYLIEAGANVNQRDRSGATALSLAVEQNNANIVRQLLTGKRKLETEIWTGPYRTALTLARLRGTKTGIDEEHLPVPGQPMPAGVAKLSEIETMLIKAGAREGWNEGELILAIKEGDTKWARQLLTKASVHTQDLDGNTSLFLACQSNDVALVRTLLKHGASAQVRNNKERTPLMEAAKNGNLDLVEQLLKADPNLDLDAYDDEGESALLEAARAGAGDVVTLLVERGANVRVTNRVLSTPLIEIARYPQLDAVNALLDKGANACACTAAHRTAIIEAAAAGHYNILKTLLERLKQWLPYDSDKFTTIINAVDDDSRTALDWARAKAHHQCARLLEDQDGKSVEDTQFMVYTTMYGHSYHDKHCPHLTIAGRARRTQKLLLRVALRNGYELCRTCEPGQAQIVWDCAPPT